VTSRPNVHLGDPTAMSLWISATYCSESSSGRNVSPGTRTHSKLPKTAAS